MTVMASLTITFVAITLLLLVSIWVFAIIADVVVSSQEFAGKIMKMMVNSMFFSSYAVVLSLFVYVTLLIWS